MEAFLEYDPAGSIHLISPTPLLMVVGAEDTLTPTDMAIAAYERARGPKSLVIMEGGKHFDGLHRARTLAVRASGGRMVRAASHRSQVAITPPVPRYSCTVSPNAWGTGDNEEGGREELVAIDIESGSSTDSGRMGAYGLRPESSRAPFQVLA
jgi:hypothetical protein